MIVCVICSYIVLSFYSEDVKWKDRIKAFQ